MDDIQKRLEDLKKTLEGAKRLVILNHDNPDPDGISCAVALQALVAQVFNIPCIVRYIGTIQPR